MWTFALAVALAARRDDLSVLAPVATVRAVAPRRLAKEGQVSPLADEPVSRHEKVIKALLRNQQQMRQSLEALLGGAGTTANDSGAGVAAATAGSAGAASAARAQPSCAFLTFLTAGDCRNYAYVGGALALVQSLLSSNTKHDIIVAIDNGPDMQKDAAKIAAQFKALGKNVKPVIIDTASIKGPHPDVPRWRGMIKKLEFWNPKTFPDYQTLVYYDADHLALQNVDDLCSCNNPTGVCTALDRTQNNKAWNREYFNAGMMVITPNATDYQNLKSMVNAKGFDLAKLKEEWFPKGKPGSLFEQDILNVYFRFRNRLFPDGYNSWMKEDWKTGHQIFKTKEAWDKHVVPGIKVVHGVLWEDNDWGFKFENWIRRAWTERLFAAMQKLETSGSKDKMCADRITKCAACAETDANCLLECIGGKRLLDGT